MPDEADWVTRLMHAQIAGSSPEGDPAIVITADGGADSNIRSAIAHWLPGSAIDRIGPWQWYVRLALPTPPTPIQRLSVNLDRLAVLMRDVEIRGPFADPQQISDYRRLQPARVIRAERQRFLVACPYPLSKRGWAGRVGAIAVAGVLIDLHPSTTHVWVTLVGPVSVGDTREEIRRRYLQLFANTFGFRYDTNHALTLNTLGGMKI